MGVDAACSGVKMLWVTLFMAGSLAARENLSWNRAGKLALTGLLLVIGLNGVRSAILFFPEAELVVWPTWTHEAVGVGLFVMVAGTLVLLANRMTQRAGGHGMGITDDSGMGSRHGGFRRIGLLLQCHRPVGGETGDCHMADIL